MNGFKKSAAALSFAAIAAFGMTACSSGSSDTSSSSAASSSKAPSSSDSAMSSDSKMESDDSMKSGDKMKSDGKMMDAKANLVGPGCADYAKANPKGDGSVNGMSKLPLASAAGANPLLTTLTKAVSGKVNPDVNLVDTLNSGEYTVFAPTDKAFEKLDKKTMDSLSSKSGAKDLKNILTYHVIKGKLNPDKIAGMHKTLNGKKVDVTGKGNSLKVNGTQVICGGVQTKNAVVYLIGDVLSPSKM